MILQLQRQIFDLIQSLKRVEEKIGVNSVNKVIIPHLGQLNQEKASSTGNEGVVVSVPNCRNTNDGEVILDVDQKISQLKQKFDSLTDQEMRVFMVIQRLGHEWSRSILYKEIAKEMQISQSSVRDYISELLAKEIPIYKEKTRNNRVLVGVKKELYDLHLASKILNLLPL